MEPLLVRLTDNLTLEAEVARVERLDIVRFTEFEVVLVLVREVAWVGRFDAVRFTEFEMVLVPE